MKISKSKAVGVAVVLLIALVGNAALSTNVDYLKSHPTAFRFWHYPLNEQVRAVMIELFPIGTARELVERVLVDGGGARVRERKTLPNVFVYTEPWLPWYYKKPPSHTVMFDNNLKVLNMRPRGGSEVYKDQTLLRDLVDEWTRQERLKHQQMSYESDHK